ncbi:von Willebrand factor A domain-containing protein 7-like [Macrobrachium nipponense]|uniref:von Willebrand factor A domain-containing protein 7-like n=1 Tax=Macrobrachium nipponense TaxID=159736 RepID=UPI0030C7B356
MPKARVLVALVGALSAIFGTTSGFLATPLNASDPDLVDILCPDETKGITRDHKWITREAIRRNLRQFFIDYPPPGKPEFVVPESASLTELYAAYYGSSASPARFIRAVNTIAESNVHADSSTSLRYNPSIQADAEIFDDYTYSMSDRYPQILTAILVDEAFPAARSLLGVTLHSLQKFYAHSTWVEQGNTDIVPDLGLPGFPGFDDPAQPDEDVCTPCPSAQGGCRDNVVAGAGLTTGYYSYKDELAVDYLVPKPATGGKCSHGGVLDDTAGEAPVGGINKDTASPCFSPHYYLHDQAAELAVKATDHYLSIILDAVDVDQYRKLFDLYHGSALSIVMDTTGSMGNEIDAVKNQVHQIVESASASEYVLVPYNDPSIGPVTKTDDPAAFLAAVDALYPDGGGDFPEMFWGGLQLALTNTPEYGAIFCFTDATGKDGELMNGNIAMAQEKNTKVTIVFSGSTYGENGLITTIDDYHTLCDLTGGLFIPSSKFDIGEITPLLDDTVSSTEVDINIMKEISSSKSISIPIDDSIFDFKVQVVGQPSTCVLRDHSGKEYNIMDEAAMRAEPNIEVISYTSNIRALRWNNPTLGAWNLDLNPQTGTLSVDIQGNSTLSWLGGFALLDPSPPHPHYMAVEGRPLTNTVYYIDVNLVGYIESKVKDVDYVEYVNIKGDVLRTIDYSGEIDDEFYIRSEPLPEEPFYVLLHGHVSSGNAFCRLMSVLITPVQASVEVASTTKELSARPGDKATGKFIVTNYGLESDFTITASDDKRYITSVTPSVHILQNSSAVVTVQFSVPASATPGTVSTVTVTAASVKQTQSVNSAVTQFVVLPLEEDHDKPTCVVNDAPVCDGFGYVGICHTKNWTASATLQDTGSGMQKVYPKPDGYSSLVDDFTRGSTDPIRASLDASCCVLQADIIGVDVVGNVGRCMIDMGVLGGLVYDFQVIDIGITWAYLRWSITPTPFEIHKYTLVDNDDYTWEFPCKTEVCYRNVTDLEPCLLQNFQLSPVFTVDGGDFRGGHAYASATTLSREPASPVGGRIVDVTETTVTVAWTPVDANCISLFQVCLKPVGFSDAVRCNMTEETSFEFVNVEACAKYEVEITPIDLEGTLGKKSLTIDINTKEGVPGKPVDLQVEIETYESALLTWWDPVDHALCVDTYIVTTEIISGASSQEVSRETYYRSAANAGITPQQHFFQEKPLRGCTNYTFKVYPRGFSGTMGPYAREDRETLETDPVPVEFVNLAEVTTTTIDAAWGSVDICLDHYKVCHYNDYDETEVCVDLTDTQTTLSDLLECLVYHVSVSSVTPSGVVSEKKRADAKTVDVAPSAPQNLTIGQVTPHSIAIRYDDPSENPQCAAHIGLDIAKANGEHQQPVSSTSLVKGHVKEHTFDKLDACTKYVIKIMASSPDGLASGWDSVEATTDMEVSGPAQNFRVDGKTTTSINLKWFEPEVNGRCVRKYSLSWEGGSKTIEPATPEETLPHEVEQLVDGLTSCTEYTFELTPSTATDLDGPVVTITDKTNC